MAVEKLLVRCTLAIAGIVAAGDALAAGPPPAYDAYSPGTGGVTVWKGFQRRQATALEFLQAPPAP
jgi:hypothetical protein